MRHSFFLCSALTWFAVASSSFATAQEAKPQPEEKQKVAEAAPAAISPFQMAGRAEAAMQLMNGAVVRAREGKFSEAVKLCEQAATIAPFLPDTHYNLGCMWALAGDKEKAFDSLQRAVDAGFYDAKLIEKDDDLKSLREEARFTELLAKAKELAAKPVAAPTLASSPVTDGVATVSRTNSVWDRATGLVRISFDLPALAPADPNAKPAPVVEAHGEVGKRITQWFRDGTAAGNIGDFYDNCDRDHSNMRKASFPQLTFIEYSPDVAKETGYGLQVANFFNGVVIGNSSTAQTAGPYWRSNPRRAYVAPRGAAVLAFQYAGNHIYFYPEHRDYDPGHNGQDQGYGDVYPANTPYVVISQGSSGSDQAFLNAFACMLAALQPDVKRKLIAEKAIAPTLQMIFRRGGKEVKSDADYRTGAAHPTVFDSKHLEVAALVDRAHSLTLETLPPIAALKMVREDRPTLGRDYFDAAERELLFDTPAAIARIWRSTAKKRSYTLSAAPSRDLNQRPLKFHWVVLRGDSSGIEIKPTDDTGATVEITMTWQPRRPIATDSKMESNRIDIGLFADNGVSVSAPAFFCVNTLDNEARVYDDAGRIQSVVYSGGADKGNYADPAFDLPKSWKDEYRYAATGELLGWKRTYPGDKTEDFTADGAVIETRDARGRPLTAHTVRYFAANPKPNQAPTLQHEPGKELLHYTYETDDSPIGRIERRTPR